MGRLNIFFCPKATKSMVLNRKEGWSKRWVFLPNRIWAIMDRIFHVNIPTERTEINENTTIEIMKLVGNGIQ
jgi:hypothetical protein